MRSLVAAIMVVATFSGSAFGQERLSVKDKIDNRLRTLQACTDNTDAANLVREIGALDLTDERRLEIMVQILDHPADLARWEAMAQIKQLGTAAQSATPRLLRIVSDKSAENGDLGVAYDALRTVSPPTPEAVEAVLAGAIGKRDDVRLGALQLLRYWGPNAQAAIPLLERLQDHESVDVQIDAFETLGRITNLPRPSLVELQTIDFVSLKPAEAHAALASVRDFGHEAAFVAPRLKTWHSLPKTRPSIKLAILVVYPELLAQDDWYVKELFDACREYEHSGSARYPLRRAVLRLDSSDTNTIRVLVSKLTDPSDEISSMAAVVLAKQGPNALPADEVLASLLERSDGADGAGSYQRLGSYLELVRAMGPRAHRSRAVVVKLLKRYSSMNDPRGAMYARSICSFLFVLLADGPMPREALPAVLNALQHPPKRPYPWMWAGAARAAGALGPTAAEATPLLVSALQVPPNFHGLTMDLDRFGMSRGRDNDFTTARLEAIRALGRIGPAANAALSVLQTIAAYNSPASRANDADYGEYKNDPKIVIPRLEAEEARVAIEAIAPVAASH